MYWHHHNQWKKQHISSWLDPSWNMRLLPGTRLESVKRRTARLICSIRKTDRETSTTGLLQQLNLSPLSQRRGNRRLKVYSQYDHNNSTVLAKYITRSAHNWASSTSISLLRPTPLTANNPSSSGWQGNGICCLTWVLCWAPKCV